MTLINLEEYKKHLEVITRVARTDPQKRLMERAMKCLENMPTMNREEIWIPCEKKQPLLFGTYLVTKRGFNEAKIAVWHATHRKWYCYDSPRVMENVIAWAYLPEVYKPKDGTQIPTTWKQQTMSRFERVE